MKIIEALKKLTLIEKRIAKNTQLIYQYAAFVSIDNPVFDTVEKQQAEVNSLIQANIDLETEYLRLKTAIDRTNLSTMVTIGTRTHSITQLITLRRKAGDFRKNTFTALNNVQAVQRLQQINRTPNPADAQNPPKVVMMYKEEEKNKSIREWDDFVSSIDGKLEVINAETDLLEAA